MSDLPYRPAAGIMLADARARVFVARRIDTVAEAWQMPQGGIDPGEEPEAAALRELTEETGIPPSRVRVVAKAPGTFDYDLPAALAGRVWGGRYRGQRQHWFLLRYLGTDDAIDLATAHPEFDAWRWADPAELPGLAVPFKRALYEDVLAAFAGALAAWA